MRAVAVVPGQRESLHLRDVPEPDAGEGEAIVRVVAAGVCGTDVEIHEGRYGEAPPGADFLILGHENLGVVEGEPADRSLRYGELVVSTIRRPCPERCRACAAGSNDMCLTGHYTERGIKARHGFMAERYAESPEYLVSVAPRLRPVAVLLEPMSVVEKGIEHAWRIQQRMDWAPVRAVVLGAGPIGILAALVLRLRGLEVTVAARERTGQPRDAHLARAGISYASTQETPLAELGRRLGPVDVVFEATGAPAVIFPAMGLLAPDGVCILSSVTMGSTPLAVDVATWNCDMVLGNRVVFGTVNSARRHFEEGARDLETAEARHPGWLAGLITRRLPFEDAKHALDRPPGDVKTVLEFPA